MAGGKGQRKAIKQPDKPKGAEQCIPSELEKLRGYFIEYKQKNRRNAEKQVLGLLDKQPTPLLRLCRAKMLFLQFNEEIEKSGSREKLKQLNDIAQFLRPNVEQEQKKSLMSCCLLVVVMREQARCQHHPDDASQFADIHELFENTINKHIPGTNWLDPKEEHLDVKSDKTFDAAEGDTPEARKVNKLKFLRAFHKEVREDDMKRRKEAIQNLDPSLFMLGLSARSERQRALAEQEKRKQPKQSADVEVAPVEKGKPKKQSRRCKEDSKRHVNQETARKIKEFLHQTLPKHGPEGSEERIKALLKLTELSYEDFERKARELVCKPVGMYEVKEVSAQIKRFKERKSWVSFQELRPNPDLPRSPSDKRFDTPAELEEYMIRSYLQGQEPRALLENRNRQTERELLPMHLPNLPLVWRGEVSDWIEGGSLHRQLSYHLRSSLTQKSVRIHTRTVHRSGSDDDLDLSYETLAGDSNPSSD